MLPVAVLCGGKGTRLGALTEHTPKYLVDVNGQPFASWQLSLLKSHGYTDIVLLTGHLHEQIEAVVGDGSQWGVQVRYKRDIMADIGPHGALTWAAAFIGEPFFALYGDSYLECEYEHIEACFHRQKFDALLTFYDGIDYGLRAFRRYPARHAVLSHQSGRFREIGSPAGLADLHAHLSDRSAAGGGPVECVPRGTVGGAAG